MKAKKFLYSLPLLLLGACGLADVQLAPEPAPPPTTGVVFLSVRPKGIPGLDCKSGQTTITPETYSVVPLGSVATIGCKAPDYEDGETSVFKLTSDTMAISLIMVKKQTLPPAPTTGFVVVGTLPANATNRHCSVSLLDGTAKIGPFRADTMLTPKLGVSFAECVADGYQLTRGPNFVVGRDTVTPTVALIPITPPPNLSVPVSISTAMPALRIDSLVRYSKTGVPSSIVVGVNIGPNSPYRTNISADSSLYHWWGSANGFVSDFVHAAPVAGQNISLKLDLKPVPPPTIDPPTTGSIGVFSSPKNMSVKVSRFSIVSNSWILVRNTTSDTTLAGLDFGSYMAEYTDPTGEYHPCKDYGAVNPGLVSEPLVCMMQKKGDVTNPPPPPEASITFTVSPLIIDPGETVTLTVSGRGVRFVFISPLGITTLGGSYTDNPLERKTYCAVGISEFGNTEQICHTVTVRSVTPPTTGTLWVKSNPTGMEAVLYRVEDGPPREIRNDYTNFSMTVVPGWYKVYCLEPGQKNYKSMWVGPVQVRAGETVTLFCEMKRKEE